MRYIGIIKLLVLFLTLLLLTGCIVNTVISETTSGNLEKQENTEEPVKWSGLGMNFGRYPSDDWDAYFNTLLANGFTQLRIFMPDYADSTDLATSKTAVLAAVAKGFDVIWGVHSSISGITAANWADFRQGILDAATWAQANGVYEFQIGNEEEQHLDGPTMTQAQLIINLKDVATDVQAIFTNGNVSYAFTNWISMGAWNTLGRGDIDILSYNAYVQAEQYWGNFEVEMDTLVSDFGVDHTYLSEFSLNSVGLDYFYADEAVQAAAITRMIDYIKASGITRAFFYEWGSGEFGVLKDDDTYRLLWSQALLNSGSVKSTTVAKTTTKISLPDTIALLILKITRKHQTRH
jgi:hypothetical protein